MNKTLRALQRGVAAAIHGATGPWEFDLAGKQVICPHCGTTTFGMGSSLLSSSASALMQTEWADKSATFLVCSLCGRMEWFMTAPERR